MEYSVGFPIPPNWGMLGDDFLSCLTVCNWSAELPCYGENKCRSMEWYLLNHLTGNIYRLIRWTVLVLWIPDNRDIQFIDLHLHLLVDSKSPKEERGRSTSSTLLVLWIQQNSRGLCCRNCNYHHHWRPGKFTCNNQTKKVISQYPDQVDFQCERAQTKQRSGTYNDRCQKFFCI